MSAVFKGSKVARIQANYLEQLGWHYIGHSGSDHHRFDHPEYGLIDIACTASGEPIGACLADAARKMGVTKREVEVRLGLATERRGGPRIRRQRNEAGRAARTFTVLKAATPPPVPSRVGTVQERMSQVAEEIRAVDVGLTYKTGEEYDSLLAERCRLRQEWMQLEVDAKAESRAAA